MTTLASGSLVTLQCDVCCPPFLATNELRELEGVGWLTRAGGHELDVCHICRRRKSPQQLVPRATNPTPPLSDKRALPNFVIVGAAKCGTTSLHAWLDTHPDISMSLVKEPQFFSDPDGGQWLEFYQSLFDPDAKVTGEASTCYTRFPVVPGVPGRMAAMVPDARLLFMVRDPIDRALSSYVEARTHSNEPREPEVAFADVADPFNPYVAASRYATQLRQYLEVFPQEQVLVLDLADLEADQAGSLATICRFLGVDDSHDFAGALARLNTREEKREYPPLVRRLRGSRLLRLAYKLPPERREKLLAPMRRALSRRIPRPELTDDLRARLAEQLAPEAAELRSLTGLPFASWSV